MDNNLHVPVFTAQGLSSDEVQDVLGKVESFLNVLKMEWDAENQESGTKNWFAINRIRLVTGTTFIIRSLDRMIQFVEDLIPTGDDKKAVVMAVAGKLFDYVVVEAFPIFMKPFAPAIRKIIVEVVVGSTIDFVVGKYNEGVWKMNNKVVTDGEES